MLPIKKILCPTDFSDASLPSLKLASELAQSFNASLHLLHIVSLTPPMPTDMLVVASTSFYPTDRERCDEAKGQIESLIKEHVPSGIQASAKIEMGHAPHEIVCTADSIGADLIVMGTHGRTGWRHLAFGSVTEAVVRTSHCPVLTVPVSQHQRVSGEKEPAGEKAMSGQKETTTLKAPETAPL